MNCENGLACYDKANASIGAEKAYMRLKALFDNGEFNEIDRFAKLGDAGCGVVAAYGTVNGLGVYAYAQDVDANFGAMNRAQAAKIAKVYNLAMMNGCPVVSILDSKGAVATEGVDALEAYGELIAAAGKISGVVPQIAVIAGTCVGSAAILASVADAVIMTKDSQFCVNSSYVTGEKAVGTAEAAAECGTVAKVCDTEAEAIGFAVALLSSLPSNNLSVAPISDYIPAEINGIGVYASISLIADAGSFQELYSDFGCCAKVGFARVAGNSVGIVATDYEKNDAKLCGNGANKIARFVRFCDAFSIPVVTLVDCAGFMGSADDELDGSIKAVATLTGAYAEATTAKVAVVVGKAYGAAWTAFAGKASGSDYVLATACAEICALEPKTAVQFLYNDRLDGTNREELENEFIMNEASAFKAAENGLVNEIVTADNITSKVIAALDMLASKRVNTIEKKHSNMPF